MYDVAVIIINYNTSKFTLQCIKAVQEKTGSNIDYQVIVVDNCSKNEDFQYLKTHFPTQKNYTLVQTPKNLGFGGGNNFGANYHNATYLLFLNNDAFLINDCLSLLFNYLNNNPKVGIATAQNYDELGNFVPSFDHNKGFRRLLLGRGFLEKTSPRRYPTRRKKYETPIKVDWVNGAFLFLSSANFEKTKGFDQSIFLYWEEMDLCFRLRKFGLESHLFPQAKITHIQGASTGSSKALNKEAYISYLYVIKKHFGFFKQILIRLYLAIIFIAKPKKWYLYGVLFHHNRKKLSLSNNV